jgi:Uma2 family endonuclease
MSPSAADHSEVDLPEKDRYTYDDYRQLPEGAPYELIRGHLARSPSPSPRHQIVQANLFFALSQFDRANQAGRVVSAPIDVQLADTSVVQPDLLYMRRDRLDHIGEQSIEGAPDLVVEILSPATAHRDLTEKKRLYEEYDVREYWVVDPDSETVAVFGNTENGFEQAARIVERGTVESTVLEGFETGVADLFSS